MIYTFLDKLSPRRKADKTYEFEKQVENESKTRGLDSFLPILEVNDSEQQLTCSPQSALIYTILGFNPETDPSIAEPISEELKNYKIREVSLWEITPEKIIRAFAELNLARHGFCFAEPRILPPYSDKSALETVKKYNIPLEAVGEIDSADADLFESPNFSPNKGFTSSGRALYKRDKGLLVKVVADIVRPLYFLKPQEQLQYCQEIKSVKQEDVPNIIYVAGSADDLTMHLMQNLERVNKKPARKLLK